MRSRRGLTIEEEWKQVAEQLRLCEDSYDEDKERSKIDINDVNESMEFFCQEFAEKAPAICLALNDYITYRCIIVMDMPFEYP